MTQVNFHELDEIDDNDLSFAVIMARYNEKWIFVKHKNRSTWEIPGGKREKHETIIEAAKRELSEETGAINFRIESICIYSVSVQQTQTFGQLFFAEVNHIGNLPNLEIGEINYFDEIPENLTYPLIQPFLAKKVEYLLKNCK